ncbi:MAG: hypothetical protein HYW90_02870 [Candidatus Sungbacteria bacterium]|nr:hypothetical protein [Candidatus Sungbacteria bacterium]
MNKIITIPKGKFVLIPHEEFEAFSRWRKSVRVNLDEQWFWFPEWQKKEAEADEAIKRKKMSRRFTKHNALVASLKRK